MRNIIQQGFTSKTGDDSKPLPIGFLTSNGRNDAKFVPVSVYGVVSNAPSNSHVLIFNAQGQASNKFGIVNDFLNRKKNLSEGEVALFNSKTGAFVLMKADGSVLISGLSKLDVDSDLNVDGNVNVTGDINVDGNANVDGDVIAKGDIKADGDVVADAAGTAISLLQHFHLGNLGFNTGTPLPSGGGVAPPASPPSATGGDLDMNGNNIVNVGTVDGKVVSTHTHPINSGSSAPGPTGAPT